ncbi:patatin-like phospholipase family protein [Paraburkholderia silvatlantica]|uniref:patatin-like phospholipase family protein n=1 Tax=Paraburkholderia silvatlantica TaxID=321895 RepID=UPI00105C5BD0|nr:patatin-like phospholipase family protein [Paraburkholderia silvatlantica]
MMPGLFSCIVRTLLRPVRKPAAASTPPPASWQLPPDFSRRELEQVERHRIAVDLPELPSATDACGLAISGGGLRSAVFSLGILQALADTKTLKRFDYLSTVSGGSYIGAFYGSLFVPDELRAGNLRLEQSAFIAQAQRASGKLCPDAAPEEADAVTPIAYLRDNCNYLVPNGLKDYLQYLVFSMRNWFAVQYVIGVSLLTILLAFGLLDFAVHDLAAQLLGPPSPASDVWWFYVLSPHPASWLTHPSMAVADLKQLHLVSPEVCWSPLLSSVPDVWCSPLIVGDPWWAPLQSAVPDIWWARSLLPGAIAVLIAAFVFSPLSRAYWLTQNLAQKTGFVGKWLPFISLFIVTSLAVSTIVVFNHGSSKPVTALLLGQLTHPSAKLLAALFVISTGVLGTLFLVIAWLYVGKRGSGSGKSWYRGSVPSSSPRSDSRAFVDRLRNALTNAFTTPLRLCGHHVGAGPIQIVLWMLLLALVDALGGLTYEATRHLSMNFLSAPNSGPLGVLAGIGAVLWSVARFLLAKGDNIVGGLSKIPRLVLASVAAVFAALATLAFWSTVALSISMVIWRHYGNDQDYASRMAILCVAFLALAMVDGLCIQFLNLSTYQRLYSTRLTRAFLGATNATRLNMPAMRDVTNLVAGDSITMGEYFHSRSHAPVHLINATINKTIDWDSSLVQRGARGLAFSIGPGGMTVGARLGVLECEWESANDISTPACYVRGESRTRDIWLESMTLGDWVAISGAAVSTGLGQNTHVGYSLLLGVANIRLGYWWDTFSKPFQLGAVNFERKRVPIPDANLPHRFLSEKLFGTQFCLMDELMGEFDGPRGRRWYLTDGGHFENTGAYELLRRKLKFIVLIDNGCDPEYQFGDIANLIRRARVDFGAEIREPRTRLPLPSWFRLNPAHIALSIGEFRRKRKFLALQFAVTFANGTNGQILVIKPRVTSAAPADVREYRKQNPSFPNETTANQFFDDVQWESHRELGYSQMCNLLRP